jgi:hypothetical protein
MFKFWLILDKITDTVFESLCIRMMYRHYDTCCFLYEGRIGYRYKHERGA